MCGFTGLLRTDKSAAIDEAELERMSRVIAHRGPDDHGTYLSPGGELGFAFRRLAIIDLSSAGHQPMCNEDGTIWIVFNGEVYNHAELKKELERLGHVFSSRADTESVIHAYEQYGRKCVDHLRGMFAFAIWDGNKRELFLARDRIGVKPLYFTQQGGRFIFGSEIKAILQANGVAAKMNHGALAHYLTFMIPPAPMTMFEGIHKLPAGHTLAIDSSGNVRQEQYWDAITRGIPEQPEPDTDYMIRVEELLTESVRLRMMSDVPYGVFLSGGVDSSTNVALMSRFTDQPLNTFSVGFEKYDKYNELKYARQIADLYKTNHREVVIDHQDALDYLPKLVWSQDEPIADWVCVPLHFVSKLVRDSGVIVAQVGEGADELFAGYPAYLLNLQQQQTLQKLGWVPRAVYQLGASAFGVLAKLGLGTARQQDILYRLASEGPEHFWGGAIVFRSVRKRRLLDTPFWRDAERAAISQSAPMLPARIYREFDEKISRSDALQRMIYLELKQRLPELLLMRVDKITMSNSIEARVPFLDHKLVEYAMDIPMEAKLRGNEPKALLKGVVRDLLPRDIIYRPKQGFSAPVAEWLRNELASEIREMLLNGELVENNLINQQCVAELIREHNQSFDRSTELWNLYNLECWHRHWIN